jgi:hypothetical protein
VAAAGTAAAGYSEAGLAAADVKARCTYPPTPPQSGCISDRSLLH